MKQVIFLNRNNNNTLFLCVEEYEYGTNCRFKTFTQAFNQAKSDFKTESRICLLRSFETGVSVELQIIDSENIIYNEIKIKSL